ncbi:hypothetical protein E2C01_013015 [Portunus trituberculatus]|uniref:Uncharacterized protein n=1 Tax=Portunus trituberculatus TaxID=210409 RepID=A0A5B7DFP8_PORTR|nr:hypothetical protein [Portunus trituberculatus]
MYSNNTYSSVTSDLGRLHLGSGSSPQQYSPGGGKKVAPVVPPKPKKSGGIGAHHQHNKEDTPKPVSLHPSLPPFSPVSPIIYHELLLWGCHGLHDTAVPSGAERTKARKKRRRRRGLRRFA